MSSGYIGLKSKQRTRKRYFFLLIFFLIIFLIYISIPEQNIEVSKNDIVKVDENIILENENIKFKELESNIIEFKQKLHLRDQLILLLKDQKAAVEKSNLELIESIKIKNLEKNKNNINSANLQQTIKKLNKEAQKQNSKILLFEEKIMEQNNEINKLNNKLQMLNNNINKLLLQKNKISSQLKNLNKIIIKKDEIIIEQDETIKNLKDKIHH